MTAPTVTREQILSYRRSVQALDARLPFGEGSLARAAFAGLQDSMPRAALLSLHARVTGVQAEALAHPSLTQVWGPRFSAYVVAERDAPLFTLGRLPDDGLRRAVAQDLARRLADALGKASMPYAAAGRLLGEPANRLRYATLTGTVRLEWDGARAPSIRIVVMPAVSPRDARLGLARRYLHVFGPTSTDSFAEWAGVSSAMARQTFVDLQPSLAPVRTPLGDAWMLDEDVARLRSSSEEPAVARLLPSGDPYFLLQGADRTLLVPDARRRATLWTSRVWPGALLLHGQIAGTWRRAGERVSLTPWRRLSAAERTAVETEIASMLSALGHES